MDEKNPLINTKNYSQEKKKKRKKRMVRFTTRKPHIYVCIYYFVSEKAVKNVMESRRTKQIIQVLQGKQFTWFMSTNIAPPSISNPSFSFSLSKLYLTLNK